MNYFQPSQVTQRTAERIAYTFDTADQGTPSALSATLYQVAANGSRTDVSGTHLTGSATAVGTVVTTPIIHSLADDVDYLLEVKYTASGNTYAPLLAMRGQA